MHEPDDQAQHGRRQVGGVPDVEPVGQPVLHRQSGRDGVAQVRAAAEEHETEVGPEAVVIRLQRRRRRGGLFGCREQGRACVGGRPDGDGELEIDELQSVARDHDVVRREVPQDQALLMHELEEVDHRHRHAEHR